MFPITAPSRRKTPISEPHHEKMKPSGNETNNSMVLDGTSTMDVQIESGVTKKKKQTSMSLVWEYFRPMQDKFELTISKCMTCEQNFSKKTGTCVLNSHLQAHGYLPQSSFSNIFSMKMEISVTPTSNRWTHFNKTLRYGLPYNEVI